MAYIKTLTVNGKTYTIWDPEAVLYRAQTLTAEQKMQAMQNIGVTTLLEPVARAVVTLRDNQAVRYDIEQTLTDEQKARARANIGALTEAEMKAYVEQEILGGAW